MNLALTKETLMKPASAPARIPRRQFLAGGATAATLTLMKPSLAFGAGANSLIELGLIGCGGRGGWISKLFEDTGRYRLVACSDYFQDRVDATGERFKIPSSRRHAGLSGYKKLLESKLDAVVIQTPPYFHPEQAAEAVEAGKHVFLSKPIAVDVPGCMTVSEAGKRATARKLVFLVDFQTRAHEFYREAVRRVRQGDLGQIIMGEAHYPWRGGGRGAPPADPEGRLRKWYYVLELSGDFIVEQSIHALDVATWILDADPVRACGMGGRKVRPGNSIYDHFAVAYLFPGNVPLSFTCSQAIPEVKDEIRCRVYGSRGVIDTDYYTNVYIRGEEVYDGGNVGNLYTTGTQTNIREFHQFITEGKYDNQTVAPSVRSNLTAILGREAGYRGGEITWEEMISANKRLQPELAGARA
jgi:myo-inositol 2-dehydrogenase / D-chiro-inositol 1-dehydrogenase